MRRLLGDNHRLAQPALATARVLATTRVLAAASSDSRRSNSCSPARAFFACSSASRTILSNSARSAVRLTMP